MKRLQRFIRIKRHRDVDDPKLFRKTILNMSLGAEPMETRTSVMGKGTCLEIGAYCSIADGAQIFLGSGHRTDWVTTLSQYSAKLQRTFRIIPTQG
jgi:hypothetical protein